MTNHSPMKRGLRITSYRLAYWHAPQRARHEESEVLDCVFCRYNEGVALMEDVVGYLRRMGFTISASDARSFTVDSTMEEIPLNSSFKKLSTKEALYEIISGTSFPLKK